MSKRMEGFPGFSNPVGRLTPIPDQFFEDLLPAIDDLAELKVTLAVMRFAARKSGRNRYVTGEELLADDSLLEGLPKQGKTAREALFEALERAAARGTLLRVDQQGGHPDEAFYFVNSPQGRAAVEAITAGQWSPEGARDPGDLAPNRPNIYRLYEQNIGMLTPLLAESLAEAEAEYPAEWIEDAIRIAVANNVRRWRYIEAILEEWSTKGRNEREDRRDLEASRQKYTRGRYSEFIES